MLFTASCTRDPSATPVTRDPAARAAASRRGERRPTTTSSARDLEDVAEPPGMVELVMGQDDGSQPVDPQLTEGLGGGSARRPGVERTGAPRGGLISVASP